MCLGQNDYSGKFTFIKKIHIIDYMFPFNKTDRLIFVNIKNSYEAYSRHETDNPFYRKSLYDCTIKYWRIASEKALSATHILGCYKGKVIEVVRINNVTTAKTGNYFGRAVFEGEEQPDSIYLGLDLHEVFDTLANFNTKYYEYDEL